MKITKRQLRRIIKEEKAKVLAEQKVRRIVRRRLMEQMDKKGHADLAQGSWYLDGNNVAMTDDDVARQFGGGPVPRDGVEAQLQSLNTLKAAGYHTVSEEDSDTPSQPIDQMIAFVQDVVDDNRSGGRATWPQASDLLSKLSRNPSDSTSLGQLEDMVRGLGSGFEVDEALDALANIEYAESEDEREEAVDYATDYVRDAFRA